MTATKPASKSRKTPKRAIISRVGVVSDWGGYLYVRAERSKAGEQRQTMSSFELRGTLKEAVKGIVEFELRIDASEDKLGVGRAEIACVGVFSSLKPALAGSVYLTGREFDLVVALAVGGRLREVSLEFQEPRYGSALIASVGFGGASMD